MERQKDINKLLDAKNIKGIVRKVDKLGRIVIPKELRVSLGLDVGAEVEILATKTGEVILRASNG